MVGRLTYYQEVVGFTPARVTVKRLLLGWVTVCSQVNHHTREVAQPCVNGDRLSKGRMAKFDPTQIRNPSTDRHKI